MATKLTTTASKPSNPVTSAIRMMLNAYTERIDLLRRAMGRKPAVNIDVERECSYPDALLIEDYYDEFRRNGIARRLVKLMPEETWETPPELWEDDDPLMETPFEQAWQHLVKRLHVWSILHRADVLSGIGRYGVVLIGFSDGDDLAKPVPGLEEVLKARFLKPPEAKAKQANSSSTTTTTPSPTDPTVKAPATPPTTADNATKRQVLYLQTYSERHATVTKHETNTKHWRFGLPTEYSIQIASGTEGAIGDGNEQATSTITVHWTRVLHVCDNRMSNDTYSESRMEHGFHRLIDMKRLLGGSAMMFWQGAFPGISFEVPPDVAAEVDIDVEAIRSEFVKYTEGLQRFLALSGVQAKQLMPTVASPKDHFEVQMAALCVGEGVPLRKFLGSEEGKQAADQDAISWNKRVRRRQLLYVTPYIIEQFVELLIAAQAVPEPADALKIEWEDLNEPSDGEKATTANTRMDAIQKYVASGADTLIPPEFFLTLILGFTEDEAQSMLEAALSDGPEDNPLDPEADPHALSTTPDPSLFEQGNGGPADGPTTTTIAPDLTK